MHSVNASNGKSRSELLSTTTVGIFFTENCGTGKVFKKRKYNRVFMEFYIGWALPALIPCKF